MPTLHMPPVCREKNRISSRSGNRVFRPIHFESLPFPFRSRPFSRCIPVSSLTEVYTHHRPHTVANNPCFGSLLRSVRLYPRSRGGWPGVGGWLVPTVTSYRRRPAPPYTVRLR